MKTFLKYLAGYVLAASIISIIGVSLEYVSWAFDRITWDFTQWPYEARRAMSNTIIGWPSAVALMTAIATLVAALQNDDL